MSVRKVKQIIAIKITGHIELPQKDVKEVARILNVFVAAQDSGDYTEIFKLMKIEKVDANQVRRTFEEPDVPEVTNHELTPVGVEMKIETPVLGDEVPAESEDDEVPEFAKRFA